MNIQSLTTAQRNTIHNLQHAQWSLQRAVAEIKLALGDSDVTDDYTELLNSMCIELDIDIEDVYLSTHHKE